ncbi:MAG: DnaD domain protein [Lachnospiraceae bacterium]|nr:DnaD domain protein [Lachnospiraceae bacterium]
MFTIYSDSGSDSTMVSNLFIDEYMKSANDAQIKVYLYLLRVMGARRTTSVSDMADQFNHTEKDVIRSLRYWEKKGLLNLTFDKEEALVSICLCRPESAEASRAAGEGRVLAFPPSGELRQTEASPRFLPELRRQAAGETAPAALCDRRDIRGTSAGAADRSPQTTAISGGAACPTGPARRGSCCQPGGSPVETPLQRPDTGSGSASAAADTTGAPAGEETVSELEALENFRADPARARLLFVIEQYIGKPLSLNEIRIIWHISRRLGFSDDLLDYLIQYCVDRGKKDFRYIRKVAENWASMGIMTPLQAESAPEQTSADRGRKAAASKKPRRARSGNAFNQFEQNSYDFDALEEELLQS